MSKKSKKSIVLLASLLTFGSLSAASLVSCGDQPTETTIELTSLTIANKDALTAEWRVADSDRQVSITADPATFDISKALDEGTLTITSSNIGVVTVMGRYLHAVAAGETTITVQCGEIKDSVNITVLPRLEMTTVTVAEALAAEKGAVLAVKGEVVQVSSKGFFVADTSGIIYVYKALDETYKLGDTVNVQGAIDEYSHIKQITSTNYKIEESSTEVDAGLVFTEYTGAELEKLSNAEISKSFPGKITVTVVADSTNDNKLKEGQVLFSCAGLADTTIIYSGYLNNDHITQIGENPLGKRFTIEGIFGGYSSHNTYTKRLNLYPVTITEEATIEVEEVQLSADLTTLKIDQKAELSVKVLPADAFGTATIEVKSGSDFVTVDGTTVTGKAAGTAVLVAKVGDVVSADLTITVLDEVYAPDTIANVKSTAKVGDNVYIKARYVSTMKNTQVYGSYFADGKDGLLVYGFDDSKLNTNDTYLITGKVDRYNGSFQVKEASVVATTEYKVGDPVVTEVTDLSTLNGLNGGDTIKVSGTVAEDITADSHGNTHFDLTVNGKTLEVRGDSRYEASLYTNALNGVKAGAAVEVVAHVAFYNSSEEWPNYTKGLQLQKIESLTIDGKVVGEEEPGTGGETPIPDGTTIAYDFSEIALNEISKFDKDTLASYLTSDNGDLVTTITPNDAVYSGDSSEGQTEFKGLKLGKKKGNGELTFTFSVDIVGVRLKGTQYKTFTSDLAVNGSYKDLSVAQGNTPETLEWGIEATKTITVGTSGRQVGKNYNNRAWLLSVEFILAE